MKTLAELIKDGFTILEDHAREVVFYGCQEVVISDYMVIQTPDGKQYLTKKDSDVYVEMERKQ
jgi:hypothetical protein